MVALASTRACAPSLGDSTYRPLKHASHCPLKPVHPCYELPTHANMPEPSGLMCGNVTTSLRAAAECATPWIVDESRISYWSWKTTHLAVDWGFRHISFRRRHCLIHWLSLARHKHACSPLGYLRRCSLYRLLLRQDLGAVQEKLCSLRQIK